MGWLKSMDSLLANGENDRMVNGGLRILGNLLGNFVCWCSSGHVGRFERSKLIVAVGIPLVRTEPTPESIFPPPVS